MNTRKQLYVAAIVILVVFISGGLLAKSLLEGTSSTLTKENQVIAIINKYRKANGLNPLTLSVGLRKAARLHSQDMINKGYFDHRGFPQRVRKYRAATYLGENIAWGTAGFAQPEGVVSLWRSSPPHKKILLTAKFKRIGVGMATGTYMGQKNATTTTANFSN